MSIFAASNEVEKIDMGAADGRSLKRKKAPARRRRPQQASSGNQAKKTTVAPKTPLIRYTVGVYSTHTRRDGPLDAMGDRTMDTTETETRRAKIIALPNGGTGIRIGNEETSFTVDVAVAIILSGATDDYDEAEEIAARALSAHRADSEGRALRAEAGMAPLSGEPATVSQTRETVRDKQMWVIHTLANVRGMECLTWVIAYGNQTFCVATRDEVETICRMVRL